MKFGNFETKKDISEKNENLESNKLELKTLKNKETLKEKSSIEGKKNWFSKLIKENNKESHFENTENKADKVNGKRQEFLKRYKVDLSQNDMDQNLDKNKDVGSSENEERGGNGRERGFNNER